MKNFKFTINGNVYEVGVDAAENGKSNVTVNGKSYVVEVEADVMQATTVRRPLATPSAASKGASGVMKSPLPGKVLKVVVAEGQVVKRGDTLMVIESMKMENNIAAQADGVVRKIMVAAEQTILQGDALLEFESVAKEEEPAPAPKPAPRPVPQQTSLFGTTVEDIRQAISLGDRFLFQRELFAGNGELMQKTLDELNALGSLEEAMDYVADNFEWDSDSTAVQLFENVLKRRFA